jgi:hypothetical protein
MSMVVTIRIKYLRTRPDQELGTPFLIERPRSLLVPSSVVTHRAITI